MYVNYNSSKFVPWEWYSGFIVKEESTWYTVFMTGTKNDSTYIGHCNGSSASWIWQKLATLKYTDWTGTTTSSGALILPTISGDPYAVKVLSGTYGYMAFLRKDGYAVIYIPTSSGISPVQNEQITARCYYY